MSATKHMPSEREIEADVANRIRAYLADAPLDGRHSDAAGANAYELLDEALATIEAASQSRAPDQSERVRELEAALAEARKVIEPFAKLADGCDHFDKHDDDFICVFHRTNGPSIAATSGDCRAARDWLSRNKESSNAK